MSPINETDELPDYITRMILERDELQDKFEKLSNFTRGSSLFLGLEGIEQKAMLDQQYHMKVYLNILNTRIARAYENHKNVITDN